MFKNNLFFIHLFLLLMGLTIVSDSRANSINCNQFWPEEGEVLNCEEYPSIPSHPLSNKSFRVFHYSDHWVEDQPNKDLFEDIKDALSKAPPVYLKYGKLPSIHIILTNEFAPNHFETGAFSEIFESPLITQPCKIQIFQNLIGFQFSRDQNKQYIAHEIFHCFQYENLYIGTEMAADKSDKWWIEGTAEFFSNLVYPSANEEFVSVKDFMILFPLPRQTNPYSTVLFFQSLANQSPEKELAILKLMRSMPESNQSTFPQVVQKLSNFPDINKIFNVFAHQYYDHTIRDTSGAYFETNFQPTGDKIEIQPENKTYTFDVFPFTLNYQLMIFPTGASYKIKFRTQKTERLNPKVTYTYKKTEVDPWQEIGPEGMEFEIKCGEPSFFLALLPLSTDPLDDSFPVDMDVSFENIPCHCDEESPLDSCLEGNWVLENSSLNGTISEYLKKKVGRMAKILSINFGGKALLHLNKNKDYLAEFLPWNFSDVMEFGTDSFSTKVKTEVSYTGSAEGKISMQGPGRICLNSGANNIHIESIVDGTPIDLNELGQTLSTPATGTTITSIKYQCSPQTLQLSWDYGQLRGVKTIFKRQ